jgi:hypothetical protein
MSDARFLIDEFGEHQNWDLETRLNILCEYIDNQCDPNCFLDFLQQQSDNKEEPYSLLDSDEENEDN